MKQTLSLDDKYRLDHGQVFITGIQALVRLPMLQAQRDALAGLNTAGFVSGYRGSPLGGLDLEMARASHYLQLHNVKFQPGLNEDLAATSVWGTQQVGLFPRPKVDGVFAMWYGKGPGVDRSGDVFRHGPFFGTAETNALIKLQHVHRTKNNAQTGQNRAKRTDWIGMQENQKFSHKVKSSR